MNNLNFHTHPKRIPATFELISKYYPEKRDKHVGNVKPHKARLMSHNLLGVREKDVNGENYEKIKISCSKRKTELMTC